MSGLSIKRLVSGGIITNYDCPSHCGHCLYNCGPHRSKDHLAPDSAGKICRRIRDLGCSSVHIGGGEPLLRPQKLLGVLAAALDSRLSIDYVETNSAWFTDPVQAEEILQDLQSLGVHTLLISISPFHNARIPFDHVKGVISACRGVGMQVFPWVNEFWRDLERLDSHKPHAMSEFEAIFGQDYLKRIPDRYWIHLGGRALQTFASIYPLKTISDTLAGSPMSCARVLSDTSHFHVDLYGSYIPGLCAGLAIDMQDLGQALPFGKYLLLEVLTATGIRGLYNLATEEYGYRAGLSGFINHCDLCTDIRTFLQRQTVRQFPELAPQGFYTELT